MFSSFGWSKVWVCWSQAEGCLSLALQPCPGSRAPFLRPHPGTAVMGYSSEGEAYGHHINVQACPRPSHRLSHFFMWPGSCELEERNPVTNVWSSQLHVQLMYHQKYAGREYSFNLLGLHLPLCSSLFSFHRNDIVSVTRHQTKCYQPQTAHFLTIAETSIKVLLNRNKEQNVQLLNMILFFFSSLLCSSVWYLPVIL